MKSTTPVRGRRSKRLKTAATAVRTGGNGITGGDGSGRRQNSDQRGDSELLALSADPYVDVDDAHERLRELQVAFEDRGDRRAIFLSVYSRMTGAVAERVRRGYFNDADWVRDYLVVFANHYREAVHNYEAGNTADLADAWRLAFDAAVRGDSLVLQDLALGVNAHINYDLALTLATVGIEPNRSQKYADHKAVTEIIRDVFNEAQNSLATRAAPGIKTLDESLGRLDEWLCVFTIAECRESAWRTAVALDSRFSLRRQVARWTNDAAATGAAHLILVSQTSERVHDTLLMLEGSAHEDN
ncbi:hypothetical protein ELS19_01905 [Halogeometricum borinquense]|uniref:Uncharacterized protein n=1 Tax=Halogeometricum borinquense TaxID=60847 RepID=A0A482T9L7_9EURY|nr:DUF5995 family protein [Halogeometricum borinquense]RYJ12846.1 hypothetical protein ELS19_01905 [Halogeometricum borinquense]